MQKGSAEERERERGREGEREREERKGGREGGWERGEDSVYSKPFVLNPLKSRSVTAEDVLVSA